LFFNCFTLHAQNTAIISGNIENAKSNTVQLTIDNLHLGKKIETKTATLINGQFTFTINADHADVVELAGDEIRLQVFVEAGDNIQLKLDGNNITFSGKGSEQNSFLKKFNDQFKNDFSDSLMQSKMLNTGVDVFEMSLFDNRKKQNDFFKNDPDKNKFSARFNEFIQNTISYRYWNLLFAYPIINANSNKGLTVNGLPTVMLDGFTKVQVNKDTALICESFREFLKYYVIYFTSQANGFNKFTDYTVSADKKLALAKERLKGEVYKFWLTKFTIDECGRLSPFITKKLFSTLKEVDKEGTYCAVVTETCAARMAMKDDKKTESQGSSNETTALKNVSNDELDLTDVNGKHVSLGDFKGKVVYVDFWASWCGPCRKMMPFSKQLHESLTDKQRKQIVFLYISIDADPESWKKAMMELGIQGVNVISPGNWNSKACRYFQIQSIPRYMIMNKKGEIVEFNANRPTEPDVLDRLMKYVVE
jgi:thiol-disulfide isomerase/thioredoxin